MVQAAKAGGANRIGALLREVAPVAAVILVLHLLLMWHALRAGLPPVDSYNSVWAESFVASLARGDFPPRWVPEAFQGLGASSFYFYPPLAYVWTSLGELVTGDASAEVQIAWGCFFMSLAASAAMYAWIRSWRGPWPALAAACAYALAPYHLMDTYIRGSLGELAAYPMIPLFALGLQRAARRWDGVPLLAIGYAGLIFAHLAIGLTVTVFAAPILLIRELTSRQAERVSTALRLGLGGVLGLALAATYLLPAMLRQDASTMSWMWGPRLGPADPASWTLLSSATWPDKVLAHSFACLAVGYAAAAIGLLIVLRREGAPLQSAARTWAWICVAAVAAYAMPFVWHSPLEPILSKIQFPFRMLVLVEFAIISAFALAWQTAWWRALGLAAAPALIGLSVPVDRTLGPTYVDSQNYSGVMDPGAAARIEHHRVPNEHLPAGFAFDPSVVRNQDSMEGYGALPLAQSLDGSARILQAGSYSDGTVVLRVEATKPATIMLRRFYFPTWEVTRTGGADDSDPLPTAPAGMSRLLSFQVQPGLHEYRASVERGGLEWTADLISVAAAILAGLMLLLPAVSRRGKRGTMADAA